MPVDFSQEARLGRLTTNLGSSALLLVEFSGTEFVNDLFEYRVSAISTEPNLNLDDLVGTHATVELDTRDKSVQYFDGIVETARWIGWDDNGNTYELVLRPWIWIASRRRNQRIFHELTVIEIIEQVLSDYSGLGTPHLQTKVKKSYETLEYTVQYRESDMDFCIRLMERFGISYHFTHDSGSHTMVLTDSVDDHPKIAGGKRKFMGTKSDHSVDEEHFWTWSPARSLQTGTIRLKDFNFKKPSASMEVEQFGDAEHQQGDIESYDYPGDYLVEGVGKTVAQMRLDQEQALGMRHMAEGDCISLRAGMTLDLTGEQVPNVKDQGYVCMAASHSYVSDSYGSGGGAGDGDSYIGSYAFAPMDLPFAPERKTPIPTVKGPQTAMVVGEGEIDCDEFGRILVHFHWDLAAAFSMRCRVSQNWAHNRWGGMVIPRIGMEVMVDFLEGDPDKPIVTGCVYNGNNMPPDTLPEYKTRSNFMTNSHEATGYNQLRFEDEGGQEEVYLQAQKYLNGFVKDNETWLTEGNYHRRTEASHSVSIGGDKDLELSGTYRETVDGSRHQILSGALVEHVKGAEHRIIDGEHATEIKNAADLFIHEDLRTETKGAQNNKVGTTYFLDVGTSLVLTAGMSISMNVGGNFIKIDPSGVTINGTLTRINSGGSKGTGKKVTRRKPIKAKKYAGPHAKRYSRSFKS